MHAPEPRTGTHLPLYARLLCGMAHEKSLQSLLFDDEELGREPEVRHA